MLTVLAWKWKPAATSGQSAEGTVERYSAIHVNRLRHMVGRHLHIPHRFLCITDDSSGLDADIETLPMWPGDELLYRHTRRLRMFSAGAREALGDRVLNLDLDTVVCGDLTPLATRSEPLVIWWSPSLRTKSARVYNPSVVLFAPGDLDAMWQSFSADPADAIVRARRHGWRNSDQAILNDWITQHGVPVHRLTEADGLYSFRDHILPGGGLPADARLVGFYDPHYDPAFPELQAAHPWITQQWV
jgi:hypothetical protein